VVPLEAAPADLIEGMGAEWRLKKKNRAALEAMGQQ
jgi:hypothetical protein